MMKKHVIIFIILIWGISISAQDSRYSLKVDVPYYPAAVRDSDDYINERCLLDIYVPENVPDFATSQK